MFRQAQIYPDLLARFSVSTGQLEIFGTERFHHQPNKWIPQDFVHHPIQTMGTHPQNGIPLMDSNKPHNPIWSFPKIGGTPTYHPFIDVPL